MPRYVFSAEVPTTSEQLVNKVLQPGDQVGAFLYLWDVVSNTRDHFIAVTNNGITDAIMTLTGLRNFVVMNRRITDNDTGAVENLKGGSTDDLAIPEDERFIQWSIGESGLSYDTYDVITVQSSQELQVGDLIEGTIYEDDDLIEHSDQAVTVAGIESNCLYLYSPSLQMMFMADPSDVFNLSIAELKSVIGQARFIPKKDIIVTYED